jgi:hypothetical protein
MEYKPWLDCGHDPKEDAPGWKVCFRCHKIWRTEDEKADKAQSEKENAGK